MKNKQQKQKPRREVGPWHRYRLIRRGVIQPRPMFQVKDGKPQIVFGLEAELLWATTRF